MVPPVTGDPHSVPTTPNRVCEPASSAPDEARSWLRVAARLAWRGHGGAEPNPCVGAVIVSPEGKRIGEGLHRRCGGPHAEIEALRDAQRRGHDLQGATMYVTLEPCHGQGRTGPCTQAILDHGIRAVVVARRDPHPKGRGGLEALTAAGASTRVMEEPLAAQVAAPFASRVGSGLPWVIAKWAQTIDGRVAMRGGDSQWISSPRSRAMVHRERGRVDAILTGIGTVLADDPLLTARGVRIRRVARRVVIDPRLRILFSSKLVRTIADAPLTVACAEDLLGDPAADALRARGVELVGLPPRSADDWVPQRAAWSSEGEGSTGAHSARRSLDLRALLRHLADAHAAATLLVEAGPGLVGSLLGDGLVDMAWIFVAPLIMGDQSAPGAVDGMEPLSPASGIGALRHDPRRLLRLVDQRRRGPDVMLLYARGPAGAA